MFVALPSVPLPPSQSSDLLVTQMKDWNWRRVAIFRKDDHFYDRKWFDPHGIKVIAVSELKENQLTYKRVVQVSETFWLHCSPIWTVQTCVVNRSLCLLSTDRLP